MNSLCNTTDLEQEQESLITELNVISEQMQTAIAENCRVAQDQEAYSKSYNALTERFETTKSNYDKITVQIKHKQAQVELLKGFIAALENSGEITNVFDEGVWSSLMDHVTINSKEDIRFIFKNGVEIRV